jgi:membrane-bound lytic murein transglycosylase C
MDTIDALTNNAQLINDQDSKGEIVKVKVRLPAASVLDRTRTYLPAVQKYSKEFKLQMPLVLAIIETESAFNPMAQSHIPAFGLMQIVPHTAGLDVQRLIYNRDQQPSSKALFNPTKNIQHGCAYLHILYYKYLKNIKNPQSRLYCTIAAYNTGAGNVAKAFIGNTNINKAAATINSKSPTDVYAHLRSNLTHKEARDYVKKVTFSINKYTA